MWNATLEWNVLIEYLLSWWSEDKTSIPNLKINELFTVQKRNHTSFSCARFAFEFEYLMETAFAYLKALYIWVKADQRKFAGLTVSYILYLHIYKKCLQSKHDKIIQVIKLYHINAYLDLYTNKKLKSLQNSLGMVQLLLFWGKIVVEAKRFPADLHHFCCNFISSFIRVMLYSLDWCWQYKRFFRKWSFEK